MSREAIRFSKPQPVKLSAQEMVESGYLEQGPGVRLPLVFKPLYKDVSATEWASANREQVRAELLRHGAVLFHGFQLTTIAMFEELAKAISPDLMQYGERSSPRTHIARNVYTSTDHPPEQAILLHNEQSYTLNWPMKIFFCCLRAAQQGGRTPIADSRRMYKSLPHDVVERFANKGVMYIRNYIGGLSLSWQEAFQTADRAAVAEYCHANGIETQWIGDQLRTRQVRPAVRAHPETGEMVWFNHALFFNVAGLEETSRRNLLAAVAEDDLPYQTRYGDGSPIESRVLDILRETYDRETVKFAWQDGDVLLVDNMLAAHGRETFSGERKVVVIMAEPFHSTSVGTAAS